MKILNCYTIKPLSETADTIKQIGEVMNHPGESLMQFLYNFTTECLETITIVSYEWLLIAGLIGLVMYIFGWDKGKKVGMMCPAIYIMLQILGRLIVCTK